MRSRASLVFPLAIWGVAAAGVAVVAHLHGYDPFDSASWARWDSIHYQGIARDGYDLYQCPPGVWPKAHAWCGDAGWFPGYPWLVRGLHLLGLPIRGTAAVLSVVFTAGTIVLVWSTFFGRRRDAAVVLALAYAAWAPGQVYDYAVFPLSMLAFFTVAHLWLLHRGRYLAAGLTGFAAVLSYPLGVLLVPVSAVWLIADRGPSISERLRRIALSSGLALAGFVTLLVDQAIETGHWNAYFLVQSNYRHTFQNPVAATRDSLRPLVDGTAINIYSARGVQTAVVTAALVAVFVHALLRRRSLERVDWLLLLWAFATWALPLAQGDVSIQRSQAALLPLAILVVRLPRPLIGALLAVAIPVAVLMEKLFLDGKIT
jgi:hypothetical protein